MDCKRCLRLLPALIEGNLSPRDEREVSAHLETCPECAREMRFVLQTREALRQLPSHQPPTGIRANIRARIVEEQAQRSRAPLGIRLGAPFYAGGLALATLCLLLLARPFYNAPFPVTQDFATPIAESSSQPASSRSMDSASSGAPREAATPEDASRLDASEQQSPPPATDSRRPGASPAPNSAVESLRASKPKVDSSSSQLEVSPEEPIRSQDSDANVSARPRPTSRLPSADASRTRESADAPRISVTKNQARPVRKPGANATRPRVRTRKPRLSAAPHVRSEQARNIPPVSSKTARTNERAADSTPELRAARPEARPRTVPAVPKPRLFIAIRRVDGDTPFAFRARDLRDSQTSQDASSGFAATESAPGESGENRNAAQRKAAGSIGRREDAPARASIPPAAPSPAISAAASSAQTEPSAPLQLELRSPVDLARVRVRILSIESNAATKAAVEVWRGSLLAHVPVLVPISASGLPSEMQSETRLRIVVEQIEGDSQSNLVQTEILTVP